MAVIQPSLKGCMSTLVSQFAHFGKLAVKEVLQWFQIVEEEPSDHLFADSDLGQLHRLTGDASRAAIDDATWNDLLLGQYCGQLSAETSIFGQQVLYQRLREGSGASERVKMLVDDPAALKQAHATCKSLRRADREIASLLFDTESPAVPVWVGKTWLLPLALALAGAASIWFPAALLVLGWILYFNVAAQMRFHSQVEAWVRTNKSLQMLLRVVSLLGGPDAGQAGRINRGITRSPAQAALPPLPQYLDWFALANVDHYFKCWRLVARHRDFLQRCLLEVANLEADVALARYLLATPQYCWAQESDARKLSVSAVVHPLLAQAQALDITLDGRGAFISGQNAVGKSTLLRTLGINLASARAFGFCHAAAATVPLLPVYSSMQSEDSMLGGESLYMAELRRAKELLAAADGPHPGIYLIDEIFRGTNHLESVSAAAAVLDVLGEKGLVVVSSHNLVLASLLEHRLAPLCVAKDAQGRLTLRAGVLAHTNGIALLAERGFGRQIEDGAARVFDWLDGYLAHPAGASGVLAAGHVAPNPADARPAGPLLTSPV